ncbi:MAG: hypothetical protein Q9223_004313, partial [Gallowayella weberi]
MPGGFSVPFSSSPPSTPDSQRRFKRASGVGDSNLSPPPTTTPGGPPPSATNSFTPAGVPPPSSIFGSSQVKPGSGLFASKQNPSNGLFSRPAVQNNRSSSLEKPVGSARGSTGKTSLLRSTPIRPDQRGRTFTVPDASSPIDLTGTNDDEDESDDDMDAPEEENDDQSDHLGVGTVGLSPAHGRRPNVSPFRSSIHNSTQSSHGGFDWARSDFGSSIGASSRSPKRPRESVTLFDASSRQKPPAKRQKKDSAIPGIVEDMSRRLGVAKLQESDFLILGTEACVGKIYEVEALPEPKEKAIEEALPVATKELCDLWRACRNEGAQDMAMESDVIIGIGPNDDATTLQKATFVAPLLLQIHHSPPVTGKQAFASSKSFRSSHTANTQALDHGEPPTKATSIPKVLHDWLEEHHDPYASAAVDLRIHTPNSTAHTNYWDILFNLLLRGKIFDVVQTLRRSDFQHAHTAREETGSKGYDSFLVKNIKIVVNRMASAFEECPILREDDWDITGMSWRKFRKRLEQALADLTVFVEGSSGEQEPEFEAPNFGLRSTTSTLGQSVRNAERQLPSIIYENLKAMYGILLGKTPEIVSSAQDWVEATLGLTIWWDGEDDDDENLAASFMQSRRSLRRSQQSAGTRTVDLNSTAAYIRRLASAFERVTDADDPDLFQINSNNAVEVALASVFEGNVEGIMRLLRGWSLPVAAATVQIASIGGWYETTAGAAKMNGFDQSDLMVLSSYSHPETGVSPDAVLVDYAEALFEKDALGNVAAADQVEGWELSMQILARLDDEALGTKKLSELLQQLPLISDKRVDRLLSVCQSFGLDREASSIAERYADYFTNETEKYGNALVYYARAGRPRRVKNILDLLISLCLVESKAIPPVSSLDENLRALIETPQNSLAILRNSDPDAAQIIHHQLTGYACLRRFYDLRDAGFNNTRDPKIASLRPTARRKAAISTLIAVINSAADNIHGGLYDEERGSVVPVDGLLALLGEALVFIDRPQREVSLSQCIDLLKAIEDLQTVTSRVYEQCEEFFRCTLANGGSRRLKRPEMREMLKKSISNVTSSSSAFSLLGSEMMGEETRESTGSEGVM